jgi:hypothetical protein
MVQSKQGDQKSALELMIHECGGSERPSQETGMRLWNRTRDGIKRDRGVDTGEFGRKEVSRTGRGGSGGFDGLVEAIGLDLSDDLRRRTGPGPNESESGIRERSAMSQGLRKSGEASKEDIQGRSSKTWQSSREGRRRRLREAALERLRDDDGIDGYRRVNSSI